MRRSESRTVVNAFIEHHPDSALMLRAEFHDRRLVYYLRQMPRMPRWKAVMTAGDYLEQFIQRISVRQPCGAFLIGGKKVAAAIESHRAAETHAGANRFAFGKVRQDALNRPSITRKVERGFAIRRIDEIRVG